MTTRTSRIWTQGNSDSATYTNNRRQYWNYDAEGHATWVAGSSYGYDVGARPAAYVASAGWVGGGATGNPSQPGLEAATTFDASGAPTKQVQTTRSEQIIGDGPQTQVSTDVSTTYYLRSTPLGGKAVAELNTQGAHITNHVYAGGMELAQPFVSGGSTYLTWLHTDPVTGSSFTTDSNRTFFSQKEIDPLGTDVTNPPPPLAIPSALQPGNLAIEAEHDWRDPITGQTEADEGMAEYEANVAAAVAGAKATSADKVAAQAAYEAYKAATDPTQKAKYKNIFDGILNNNPNVGIIVTKNGHSFTLWGKEAADFLDGLGSTNLTGVGGHSQKTARPDLPDYIHNFYKTHQGTIDRCINRVFGQKADGTADVAATVMARQTIANAPQLDYKWMTQSALQAYTETPDTLGMPSLYGTLGHGTVYIASDLYPTLTQEEATRAFFHELGNILSGTIVKDAQGSPDYAAFGDPKGIGNQFKDKDTGARLEKCIFKTVLY